MFRFLAVFAAVAGLLSPHAALAQTVPITAKPAPPESDTARKVRVALALAGGAGCGVCRADLDDCRADALRLNRPLVLFVGPAGCEGKAKELPGTDAIYCRVPVYSIDGKAVEGVVILGKDKSHKPDTLYILEQLPKGATSAEIKAAVKLAHDKAPATKAVVPLDWNMDISHNAADDGADVDSQESDDSDTSNGSDGLLALAQPAIFQDCPNGRCAVPAAVSQTVGRVTSAVRGTGADCGCAGCSGAGSGRARKVLFTTPDGTPRFPRLARLFGRG